MYLSEGEGITWSKVYGLLSAQYIVISNASYDEGDILVFPKPFDKNLTRINEELASDPNLTLIENFEDLMVYENRNSLPLLYASDYFVLYDEIGTLRYALDSVNMTALLFLWV